MENDDFMDEKIKILLVDDDEFVTMSLEMIFEAEQDFVVVGKAHSGKEGIDCYVEQKPDVVIMDIRMKDINGLEASEKILNLDSQAKILLLTTFSDNEYITRALNLGVKGYLLKENFRNISAAVRAVIGDRYVYDGHIISKLPSLLENEGRQFDYKKKGISDKEFEIIQLISDGLSNKEISEKIFLSEGTIKNYISSILNKLELRDRTQIAIFYLKNK